MSIAVAGMIANTEIAKNSVTALYLLARSKSVMMSAKPWRKNDSPPHLHFRNYLLSSVRQT